MSEYVVLLSVPGLVHLMQWVVLVAEFLSPALLFVRGRLLWLASDKKCAGTRDGQACMGGIRDLSCPG